MSHGGPWPKWKAQIWGRTLQRQNMQLQIVAVILANKNRFRLMPTYFSVFFCFAG